LRRSRKIWRLFVDFSDSKVSRTLFGSWSGPRDGSSSRQRAGAAVTLRRARATGSSLRYQFTILPGAPPAPAVRSSSPRTRSPPGRIDSPLTDPTAREPPPRPSNARAASPPRRRPLIGPPGSRDGLVPAAFPPLFARATDAPERRVSLRRESAGHARPRESYHFHSYTHLFIVPGTETGRPSLPKGLESTAFLRL
jgi:hypothetical protein